MIYGHLAEVMLSQPATKFVLKTAEPKAAKWASELIGDIEIERVRETVADGKRAGKSFTMDRQIEPLVMSSEIAGLEDLHSFLKLGNNVTRFSFPPYGQGTDCPVVRPPRHSRGGYVAESSRPSEAQTASLARAGRRRSASSDRACECRAGREKEEEKSPTADT